MRIRWRNFELPSKVIVDELDESESYGRFFIEPFEKGFGHTIGNGLRRVLLSSIEGTAVTAVKVEGVPHEFTTIKGVLEDVTEIILNLKGLLVDFEQSDTMELHVTRKGAGEMKAGDMVIPAGVSILNPDHVFCTMTEDVEVSMTITVARGRGYVTAEEHEEDEKVLGVIAVDSNFSPVKRVRYHVEETRVGMITNYDRLVLEIWTDGTVCPEDALVEASRIYRKHLNVFVQYHDVGMGMPGEEVRRWQADAGMDEMAGLKELLQIPIDDLALSVRSRHCLDSENIATVGELVRRTEADLLKVRNFGKTSLHEIRRKLEGMGLSLGMPPVEELTEADA